MDKDTSKLPPRLHAHADMVNLKSPMRVKCEPLLIILALLCHLQRHCCCNPAIA